MWVMWGFPWGFLWGFVWGLILPDITGRLSLVMCRLLPECGKSHLTGYVYFITKSW